MFKTEDGIHTYIHIPLTFDKMLPNHSEPGSWQGIPIEGGGGEGLFFMFQTKQLLCLLFTCSSYSIIIFVVLLEIVGQGKKKERGGWHLGFS